MGQLKRHHISSFNPTWCMKPPLPDNKRTSRTSVTVNPLPPPKISRHRRCSTDNQMELSSPRVSCMGQIKKCNKGARSWPSSPASSLTAMARLRSSLLDLGRAFSGRSSKIMDCRVDTSVAADMDPPLPVVAKLTQAGEGELVGLWSRRCSGGRLEGLRIEQPCLI